MFLLRRCLGEACGPDQTCGETGCRSIDVGALPEWDGVVPRLDQSGRRRLWHAGADAVHQHK